MISKIILSCLLLGSVFADTPGYGYEQPSYKAPEKHEKGMPFDFAYAVQDEYSGNQYGHNSNSDGNTVNGEYRVLLPDGRTQIVSYTADHYKGFQAEVNYEGEAKPYVAPYKAPKAYKQTPSYSAPAPIYEQPPPAYDAPAPAAYEEPQALYGAPTH